MTSCRVDLPTTPFVSDVHHLVSLTGVLSGARDDSGVYAVWISAGTLKIPVIWPRGFSARIDPLEILDSAGALIARAGDTVTAAGGMQPTEADDARLLGQASAFYAHSIHASELKVRSRLDQ